jgi:hypothetical protein
MAKRTRSWNRPKTNQSPSLVPARQRLDGVKYLDTDQWLAMKPVLKVVEDALVQAGKK